MSTPASERLPLGRLLARHTGAVAATLVLCAIAALSGVALLGVSGWFITGAALTTAAALFNLFGPSALVRMLSFTRILSRYGEKLIGHDVTLRLLSDIRDWTFRRLIPRVPLPPMAWRHGDLVSRLVADVDALQGILVTAIGPAVTTFVAGAALLLAIALLMPAGLLVFALGYGAASLAVPAVVAARSWQAGRRLAEGRADLRVAVLDVLQGFTDILACDGAERALNGVAQRAGALAETGRHQNRITAAAARP